jgi:hypothetical protein
MLKFKAQLKYFLGRYYRLLTKPLLQYTIDPSEATTIFACSFGRNGWHHIIKTLDELKENPELDVSQTSLFKFLKNFRPISVSTLAGVFDENPLRLFEYPWGSFTYGMENKKATKSRFCGPSSNKFIVKEFQDIIYLYKKIKDEGYLPEKFSHSYICGTWLIAKDGQRKFVVMQGNHRMAILSHLGLTKLKVRSMRNVLKLVRETEVRKWPLVKSGRCSEKHAIKIFQMFFNQNGWHIANNLCNKNW